MPTDDDDAVLGQIGALADLMDLAQSDLPPAIQDAAQSSAADAAAQLADEHRTD
jgi:hypothetical protein